MTPEPGSKEATLYASMNRADRRRLERDERRARNTTRGPRAIPEEIPTAP